MKRCSATTHDDLTPSGYTQCIWDEGHDDYHRHVNAKRKVEWDGNGTWYLYRFNDDAGEGGS